MGDISYVALEIHWQTQTNRDPHGTNLVSATCDLSLFVLFEVLWQCLHLQALSNWTFGATLCRTCCWGLAPKNDIIDVSVMSNLVWDISMQFAEIPHSGSGMTDTRGATAILLLYSKTYPAYHEPAIWPDTVISAMTFHFMQDYFCSTEPPRNQVLHLATYTTSHKNCWRVAFL